MTVSHWRRTTALGNIQTDVLIVGAGICGVSAALALQRRGVDYRIVERHSTGWGASTRNAGFLMRGAAANYKTAIDIYGRDLARTVWRWTEENVEGLRREGIESLPTYQRIPSCLLALEREECDQLLASVELLKEDGFETEWVESGDDSAWTNAKPLGGLLNPGDSACNSYDLLRFLAGKLDRPVMEQQEVAEIRGESGGVLVRTSDALIRAKQVLLCTNAYAPLLMSALADAIVPRRGQMIALANRGLRLDCSYYANYGFEYFRQTTDGTVVVGGCRRKHAASECGYDDQTTPAVQGDLEAFASLVLGVPPGELRISARWSGTMAFTPDGLPAAGPVPGPWESKAVWFCGGFTGHGMSMAHRTAEGIVEEMLGGPGTPFSLSRFLGG